MASFATHFSPGTSSIDGKYYYLTDESNYLTNDQGWTRENVLNRQVKLYDAEDTLIAVVEFYDQVILGIDTVEIPIEKDQYLRIVLVITMPGLLEYEHSRILPWLYIASNKLQEERDRAVIKRNVSKLSDVRDKIEDARTFGRNGDGVEFDEMITAANKLLDSITC